jgi:hypothetical protein
LTHDAGVTREERHFRRIDIRGYLRSDGLFEVVGQLIDQKPPGYVSHMGVQLAPGMPLHDMGVRLVFDHDLIVREVTTFTDAAPYRPCPGGGAALQAIVGVRIGKGWTAELHQRLPRSETCTHLRELLGPMATAAIQTRAGSQRPGSAPPQADERPAMIDSCYAYAAHREVVLERWPQWHTPLIRR